MLGGGGLAKLPQEAACRRLAPYPGELRFNETEKRFGNAFKGFRVAMR
jgi:hypothetical protein